MQYNDANNDCLLLAKIYLSINDEMFKMFKHV